MLKTGEKQTLIVEKNVRMGVFLMEEKAGPAQDQREEHVLLPLSQVPAGTKVGDKLEVFLYKDSQDRLIATRKEPALTLHEVGWLIVKEVGKIGAFLDWGLDKDLLLPFREQPRNHRVQKGQRVLCAVYLDRSGRLAATMNVYPWLDTDSLYHEGDVVNGTVYETSENFGWFVAVDDRYSALIPMRELVRRPEIGEQVQARVTRVHPDGRLDLSLRKPKEQAILEDAERIEDLLAQRGGVLMLSDRSDPEEIRRTLQMSKAQFKRAAGHLLREGRIRMEEDRIVRILAAAQEIK